MTYNLEMFYIREDLSHSKFKPADTLVANVIEVANMA